LPPVKLIVPTLAVLATTATVELPIVLAVSVPTTYDDVGPNSAIVLPLTDTNTLASVPGIVTPLVPLVMLLIPVMLPPSPTRIVFALPTVPVI